jgi:hypothetical protein
MDREKPLTGFRISTVAFATTAPEGSTTVPTTDVELPVCPCMVRQARKNANKKAAEKDLG